MDNLWITRARALLFAARKLAARSQSTYRPPNPPFFDKHALEFIEQGLRVTMTSKNVIYKKILKK